MTTLNTATQSNDSTIVQAETIDNAIMSKADKQAHNKALKAEKLALALIEAEKQAETQAQSIATIQSDIINALITRKSLHETKTDKQCLTLDSDIKRVSSSSFLNALTICTVKHNLDLSLLSVSFAQNDNAHADFVAVKAITKILRAVFAIAQNNAQLLDGYTQAILMNLVRVEMMNTYECYKACSKSIVVKDQLTDVSTSGKKIVSYMLSAASTASTQTSSTRMMLRMLDICEVKKASKGDILTFKSNATSALICDMFKVKDASDESEIDQIMSELSA